MENYSGNWEKMNTTKSLLRVAAYSPAPGQGFPNVTTLSWQGRAPLSPSQVPQCNNSLETFPSEHVRILLHSPCHAQPRLLCPSRRSQSNLIQEIYWERGIQESRVIASAGVDKGSSKLNRHRASIGLLRGWNLTGWRFPEWELVRFQSPWSWESSDWLDFLLRDWLVLCSVGQVQVWLWFQGWSVILLLVLFSLLAPVSGPGCFSFTGSCYRAKECFFSSGQSVFLWLALFPYTV